MMKQALKVLAILLVLLGAAPPAGAVTVSEFDSFTQDQQILSVKVIVQVAHGIVKSQNASETRLACIVELYSAPQGLISKGVVLLHEDLDEARQTDPSQRVETLVMDAIERECPGPD